MSTLELKADGHVLSFKNKPILATGSENVDKLSVTFDAEWNGYARVAVMYIQNGEYSYSLFDDEVAKVPSSILSRAGNINIGLIGIKDGSQITTNILKYKVKDGTYTEYVEPDATVYNQLLSAYASNTEDIKNLKNDITNNYAKKSDVTNCITPKGTIAYAGLASITGVKTVGDYYYCPDGDETNGAGNYVWNGTSWFYGGTGDEGYNTVKNELYYCSSKGAYLKEYTWAVGKYQANSDNIGEATTDANFIHTEIVPVEHDSLFVQLPHGRAYCWSLSEWKKVDDDYVLVTSVGFNYDSKKVTFNTSTQYYTITIRREDSENMSVTEGNGISVYSKSLAFIKTAGVPIGTNINLVLQDGNYVGSGATNVPAEIGSASYFLHVESYGRDSRWKRQVIWKYGTNNSKYERILDTESTNITTWVSQKLIASRITKLFDKKFVFLGDSITYGLGTSDREYDSFVGWMTSQYGLDSTNLAVSGSTLGRYGDADNACIIKQAEDASWTNVDYCFIFGGTNDYGKSKPIGTYTDTVENTMCGGLNKTIQTILTANPNVRIGILVPTWRSRLVEGDGKDCDTNTNSINKYLKEYVDAIVKVADYNHIPCLNWFHSCGFNQYTISNYLSDGLHPNNRGHRLLSSMAFDWINSIY